MNQQKPPKNKNWFMRHKVISIILGFLILGIIGSIAGGDNEASKNSVNSEKPSSEKSIDTTNSPAEPKTLSQIIQENIPKEIVATEFQFKNFELEENPYNKAEQDSKIARVEIKITNYWDRDAVIRNTGQLSADLFKILLSQESYNTDKITDAEVYYYFDFTDQYGNLAEEVGLTYVMDKTTAEKINWDNFDKNNLGEFLNAEMKISPNSHNLFISRLTIK